MPAPGAMRQPHWDVLPPNWACRPHTRGNVMAPAAVADPLCPSPPVGERAAKVPLEGIFPQEKMNFIKGARNWRSILGIKREGISEAAPEAVRQAVGGGCQSGWGRSLLVTKAGTCRSGDSGWHRLGGLEGGGGGSSLPMHPCPPPPPPGVEVKFATKPWPRQVWE